MSIPNNVNPFDVELHREAIDDHKANRLSNPYKRGAYSALNRDTCVRAWVEQIGDAELYEQRWHELGAEQHD